MLALSLAAGGVAQESRSPQERAAAVAIAVSVPEGPGASSGAVSAPPQGSATVSRFAYPADGSVVSAGVAYTSARPGPGASPRAEASATVRDVSLFGGEIEVAVASAGVLAAAHAGEAAGDFSGSGLEGLTIEGQPVAAAPNTRVSLGDWGYVVLLEQSVLSEDGEGPGYRGVVTALHVHLTAEHGGLPVGSEILVASAEAAVRAPRPPETEPASPQPSGGGSTQEPDQARDPVLQPPGAPAEPPLIVRNPPPNVRPDITRRGYVFPVYGPVSFSDDFGAPRATTGWHHGNDIFAPLGTPVLAVADGTLFSVGWNGIGGWRLWLRDGQGNEYYYAHLSAFSPLAVNGARVSAGDVVGFVGDTGDARGTPPHLHFEVHPAALLGLGYDGAINPYPYLLAWHEQRDESFAAAADAAGGSTPGAVLLEAEDISSASGLYPGAIVELLGLIGVEGALPSAQLPPLIESVASVPTG